MIYTPDGFLLTNAHVVGQAEHGTALFADGTSADFRVVGADPLSDLAVVRADGPTPEHRPSSARLTNSSSVSSSSPWAARSGSPAQ